MDIKSIKELIHKEIAKTKARITEFEEMAAPVAPDNAIGRVSRMDAINNKSVSESALRKALEKLKTLKYVITKVDSADFGICIKCKKPIPLERILFRPESLHCVNCAF